MGWKGGGVGDCVRQSVKWDFTCFVVKKSFSESSAPNTMFAEVD